MGLPANRSPNQLITEGAMVAASWTCPTSASHNDVRLDPAAHAR